MAHHTDTSIHEPTTSKMSDWAEPTVRPRSSLQSVGAWVPIIVFGVFAMATLLLWLAIEKQQQRHRTEWLQKEAQILADQIEHSAEEKILAVNRIGKRWVAQGGVERTKWEQDARSYVMDYTALQAISWVDTTGHVRWIVPMQGNEAAIGLRLSFEERRAEALKQAREQNQAVLSQVVDLVQGGKGMLLFVPLKTNGRDDGFISAVLRPDA